MDEIQLMEADETGSDVFEEALSGDLWDLATPLFEEIGDITAATEFHHKVNMSVTSRALDGLGTEYGMKGRRWREEGNDLKSDDIGVNHHTSDIDLDLEVVF